MQVLQTVHEEGLQVVYSPNPQQQTAFGFGRANGILQTVQRCRELFEGMENERDEKQRLREQAEI